MPEVVGCVAYGSHGADEPLSVEIGRSLEFDEVEGIVAVEVNPLATMLGVRMVDENSAASFRHADENSPVYERREAARVIQTIEELGPDFTIDYHTTASRNSDVAFVNPRASQHMIGIAQFLGFKDIIISDFGNIGCRFPNTLNVEVSDDPANHLRSVTYWRRALRELVEAEWDEYTPPQDTRLWQHVGTILLSDVVDDPSLSDVHALTWSEGYMQYGAIGEVIVPASPAWKQFFLYNYNGRTRPAFDVRHGVSSLAHSVQHGPGFLEAGELELVGATNGAAG